MRNPLYLILLFCLMPLALSAQGKIGTGKVQELFNQMCAGCHGEELLGSVGTPLVGPHAEWKHVGKTVSFLEYVKEGNLEAGMPPFKYGLDDKQIRSLEIYIAEKQQIAEREGVPVVDSTDGVYQAGGYTFRLETVLEGLTLPWSIAFYPGGGGIVTERGGNLRQFKEGQLMPPVQNAPQSWSKGQGGMLEVALHPDYKNNGWVYVAFAGTEDKKKGMTKIVRGRIQNNTWQDEAVIFESPSRFHHSTGQHWGTRLVFHEGYLFFSIGDRGKQGEAQDLSKPNGKVHRIHDDGRVPEDNPFVSEPDAYPTIWTYGNRNPQGLDLHPLSGRIWESEHGPRGGDEINLIEGGNNYGWPLVTHGMNYSGTPITDKTTAPGMEAPKHYWTPSIAVCGIDFYEGNVFPEWKHNLMVGGLRSQEVHRLVIEDGQVVQDEIIVKGAGKIRDIASGLDGYLYLVLNSPDKIVRLVPEQ